MYIATLLKRNQIAQSIKTFCERFKNQGEIKDRNSGKISRNL